MEGHDRPGAGVHRPAAPGSLMSVAISAVRLSVAVSLRQPRRRLPDLGKISDRAQHGRDSLRIAEHGRQRESLQLNLAGTRAQQLYIDERQARDGQGRDVMSVANAQPVKKPERLPRDGQPRPVRSPQRDLVVECPDKHRRGRQPLAHPTTQTRGTVQDRAGARGATVRGSVFGVTGRAALLLWREVMPAAKPTIGRVGQSARPSVTMC